VDTAQVDTPSAIHISGLTVASNTAYFSDSSKQFSEFYPQDGGENQLA